MNNKIVKYKGLEITGDANKIDELLYGKENNEFKVKESEAFDIVRNLYKFNSRFIPTRKDMTIAEITQWIKQFIICIHDELSELLEELPWKHWKDYSDYKMNLNNIKGEIADILIFTFGICGILDVSPEEIFAEIAKKNEVNNERQERGY
jgi:NTP pyrophosphatase (non-canonical NTP hydrolase)